MKKRIAANKSIIVLLLALPLCLLSLFAQAELVVVVAQSNPVSKLSPDEVRRIFLGRLQLFPRSHTSIQVIDQREASSAFAQFYKQVANKSPMQIARYRASFLFGGRGALPVVAADDQAVLNALQQHPGGIAYMERSAVDVQSGKIVAVLPE